MASTSDITWSVILQEFTEPAVILLILLANAFIGLWQQSGAEEALEALQGLQCPSARVKRDGEVSIYFHYVEYIPPPSITYIHKTLKPYIHTYTHMCVLYRCVLYMYKLYMGLAYIAYIQLITHF